MFFQDATPDTSSYMILGYAIFFIVTAIYLVSFFVRSRNLKQDIFMLESMKPESKVAESKAPANKIATGKTTTSKKTGAKSAKAKTAKPKSSTLKTKKK